MFEVSGIAVSNATEELLKYATVVTASNNEDGITKYLKKLVR